MTTTTHSNTVFRINIILNIINVMNNIAVFFTYRADVIVALAYHFFKLSIKCWRIRIKRYSSAPSVMILSNLVSIQTFFRTKFSPVFLKRLDMKNCTTHRTRFTLTPPTLMILIDHIFSTTCTGAEFSTLTFPVHGKPFTAIQTKTRRAFGSTFIGTFLRTIFSTKENSEKWFAAILARYGFSAPFVSRVIFTNNVLRSPNTIAFAGATTSFREMARFYMKRFIAYWASFFHSEPKRCFPQWQSVLLFRQSVHAGSVLKQNSDLQTA